MVCIRRRLRFHGLKRPKLRADWNKYNLYNLSRLKPPVFSNQSKTLFQQKWAAKAATRAYHGEPVREKQWQRMFSRRMSAVVPMSHEYLALKDGSELAAGRGSGKEGALKKPKRTPYMNMVYAPVERRLDTAVFRALFASSARQARQLVVHGHVRVNGVEMRHPSYLLNPGDMFLVNPDMVMASTGRKKRRQDNKEPRAPASKNDAEASDEVSESSAASSAAETTAQEDIPLEDELANDAADDATELAALSLSEDPAASIKRSLLQLRQRTKDFLASPPSGSKLSARKKQDLREFSRRLRTAISKASSTSQETLDELSTEFVALESGVTAAPAADAPTDSGEAVAAESADVQPAPPLPGTTTPAKSKTGFWAGLKRTRDVSKPYRTPWYPRPYMSAFAFIPRYLEVNQNICAAVYLRHPVARPGFAEVPTPFHPETGQLTFIWYLRRR